MWSKRRRKFRKKYNVEAHRFYLIRLWFENEFTRRLSEAIDRAFLYGEKHAFDPIEDTIRPDYSKYEEDE